MRTPDCPSISSLGRYKALWSTVELCRTVRGLWCSGSSFVLLPSLGTTLARSERREKRVREELIRAQHARCATWDEDVRIDTTGLDLDHSLALVLDRLRGA